MAVDTTKDRLERIRNLTEDLLLKQRWAWFLRAKYTSSGPALMPWQEAELSALEDEIQEGGEELGALRREALGMIRELHDSVMEYILVARYLDGMTWREISERSGYSRTWVTKLHARGIEAPDAMKEEKPGV